MGFQVAKYPQVKRMEQQMGLSNYPDGLENHPDAPWNEKEVAPEPTWHTFTKVISITVKAVDAEEAEIKLVDALTAKGIDIEFDTEQVTV